jgi:catechol 2,3-dioxygenase-like lactoylglutathione lyase family enzyme
MIHGINGAHWVMYSNDAEADRAFFKDVLGFRAVDAGEGWLIFVLPPSEMGVHPVQRKFTLRHADQELTGAALYLTCDDVHATLKSLEPRDVPHTPIAKAEWGLCTILRLPSGGKIGLYQPTHPRAA